MDERELSKRPRSTVARRVLLSYLVVMTAFALVAGWSALELANAKNEAELMRTGYFPLGQHLRDLAQMQDKWNTQLNHVTSAQNPADIQIWFDAARVARPKQFERVQDAIRRAFITGADLETQATGRKLLAQANAIENYVSGDQARLNELFDALAQRDITEAEALRKRLARRGLRSKRLLTELEQRVQANLHQLYDEARRREKLAIQLLILLSGLTLAVGVAMAFYAQQVLKPLAAVTARAESVAKGDLTPRTVVASDDEIGELASTFEGMVSAIANARERLLAAERLATIGKMAAHVTHEVRNPLSSIALNLELLQDEISPHAEEAHALLRAISAEVERLTSLSEQYLSMSRRQPLRPAEEDMGELVAEAVEFVRRDLQRHGVSLKLDVAESLPPARVDEAQLKQALFNLIRNAREAMPEGGSVLVRVYPSGDGVDVAIEDEGVGINEATRAQLFEPFFTTKEHGTGLGLAITQQIVEAHSGSIQADARAEGGTRIVIHVPSCESSPTGTPVLPAESSENGHDEDRT